MDAALITIHDSRFTKPRRLTWLFDLDNTLHDASRAAFGPTNEAMTRYIAGRLETPADRPMIHKLLTDFQKSQFRFKDLIVSLLLQREFPNREGTVHVASNH